METQALYFAELKLAVFGNVGDSGAQFLVGGDCIRAFSVHWIQTEIVLMNEPTLACNIFPQEAE